MPLWWRVDMKNKGLGEAEIKLQEKRTFKGSCRWVVVEPCAGCNLGGGDEHTPMPHVATLNRALGLGGSPVSIARTR